MKQHSATTTYDPNRLLNAVCEKLDLKNDAALARMLGIAPPVISKVRHHTMPIGASLQVRIHEETGLSSKALRLLMGDRRAKFRSGQRIATELRAFDSRLD